MLRKTLIAAAVFTAMTAAPAYAGNYGGSTSGWNNPKPCKKNCGSTSTSGNTTSTSSGTQVPEPGMLGIAGLGLMGLGYIRLRRRKNAKA